MTLLIGREQYAYTFPVAVLLWKTELFEPEQYAYTFPVAVLLWKTELFELELVQLAEDRKELIMMELMPRESKVEYKEALDLAPDIINDVKTTIHIDNFEDLYRFWTIARYFGIINDRVFKLITHRLYYLLQDKPIQDLVEHLNILQSLFRDFRNTAYEKYFDNIPFNIFGQHLYGLEILDPYEKYRYFNFDNPQFK